MAFQPSNGQVVYRLFWIWHALRNSNILCILTGKLTPILAFFCLPLLWLFTEESDWLLDVHACKWEVHRCFLLFYAVSCSFALVCVVFKRWVKICNKKLQKTALCIRKGQIITVRRIRATTVFLDFEKSEFTVVKRLQMRYFLFRDRKLLLWCNE